MMGQIQFKFRLCQEGERMDSILKLDIVPFLDNLPEHKNFLLPLLQSLTIDLQNPDNRFSLSSVAEFFCSRMKLILENYEDDEILRWTLRTLRNAAVENSTIQTILYKSKTIDVILNYFLRPLSCPCPKIHSTSQSLQALGLQVIGNSLVAIPQHSSQLILEFNAMDWITQCLDLGDDRVKNYAAMVGLNLTRNQPQLTLAKMKISCVCVQSIIDQSHLEFPVLWFESLISIQGFLTTFYPQMDDGAKVKWLHLLTVNSKIPTTLPTEVKSLEFLIKNFKNYADRILTTTTSIPQDFNVLEMTAITETFCKLIGGNRMMKDDPSFVVSTIALLRSIHEIGISGENYFTPIDKLEHSTQQMSESIECQPGFLFKADLIRLVGSLVEGHLDNQNKVREMGLLSIILNCTKIDARNPFIPQCSILTLKYLLEGNPQNQHYVNQLQKE